MRTMSLAPYLSTPLDVVEKMLEAAKLKSGETLYDLGSGDGRIIIMAAEKYGAIAVGVELDEGRARESRQKIRKMALEERVQVIHGNIMDVDINSADVVTLYLTTRANTTIKPKLEAELKPGTRVVSHDYEIRGWTPLQVIHVYESGFGFNDEYYGSYTIYVYQKK
jgi:16S rRNA A1518/A1519 N6-dimethyltransferase RsmA/KsgA/DIM1 with predicted DNA glycosylase/AP lyase activity